ncbi:hypothetical protein FOZ60_008112 [Perkinsus olseni]|uniref:RED-like N-terminal domain-containing protein n=1 Tax=Perkinsus olseni TaxID=32597 RepID=A0A7J6NMB2_PEROL|nr:hypothetical protein FOZ60_008112 [Perkinsus olseni]
MLCDPVVVAIMISSNEAFKASLLEQSKADEEAITKKKLAQAKKKEKRNQHHHQMTKKGRLLLPSKGLGYRDRVLERRKGISNEINAAEADWDKYNKLSVEESMYLGGDEATTHLVKGLDTQLANRIKDEMRKKAAQQGVQRGEGGGGHRDDDDHYNKNKSTAIPPHTTSQHSSMGSGITRSLFGPGQLHPHRYGIPIIIQKQTKQIGQMGLNAKIKGASRRFLDGRCAYNMNIDPNDVEESVPIEVYQPVQDNNEDCDTKLYVARYNEEIVTEMIAAMLRKKTGGKRSPGQHADNNNIQQQREDNTTEGRLSSQRQQQPVSQARAVDGDVDIFAYDGGDDRNDDTKGNSSSSSGQGVLAGKTNEWQQSNEARSSRNYFGGDQEQQEGEDTNDEVTRLTKAVHEHLVAKKIEKEEESRMSLRGDFLAGGDYDECYVGYGTLEGFGQDVGVDKELLSNKNNKNNKRNKRKGLDDDDDEDGTKKSKMGESAQLKAVMKRVEEMKEG